MTNSELFKLIFGTDGVPTSCVHFNCDNTDICSKCKYRNFWEKEADLAVIGANIFTEKELGKAMLNSMFGCSSVTIYGNRAGHSRVEEGVLLTQGWKKLPSLFNRTPLKVLYDILDDATANGFEVKVHNGVIYYRECTYQDTDTAQDID